MSNELPTPEYDYDRLKKFNKRAFHRLNLPPKLKQDDEWLEGPRNSMLLAESLIGVFLNGPTERHTVEPSDESVVQAEIALEYLMGASEDDLRASARLSGVNPSMIGDYALQVASQAGRSFRDLTDEPAHSSMDLLEDQTVGRPAYELRRIEDAILDIYEQNNVNFTANYAKGLLWALGERELTAGSKEERRDLYANIEKRLSFDIRQTQQRNFKTARMVEDEDFEQGCNRIHAILKLANAGFYGPDAREHAIIDEIMNSEANRLTTEEFKLRFEGSIAYAIDSLYGDNRAILRQ